jgi:DNA-binding XRE family transcriptional regulator
MSANAVTGNQIRAARCLAGIDQATIAKAAGLTRQALVAMERSGPCPVVSRASSVARVLAALGARGVMLVPNGVVLAE